MNASSHIPQENAGGAFSVDRVLSAVRRRLKIVIAMPIIAAALSVLFAMSLPTRYDASAVVQIDSRKKTISNLEGVLSELKADGAVVDSEEEIIASRLIALKVIDILKLREDPEFSRPPLWRRTLTMLGLRAPDLPTPTPPLSELGPTVNIDPLTGMLGPDKPGQTQPVPDEVAVAFAERLKVTRVRKTLLIDIRFSAETAVKAAKIANTVAEVYLAEQLRQKHEVTDHAAKLLKQKLDSLRTEVTEAEHRVAQFKAENDIIDSEGQILGEKQLARLMEQTVIARNNTAEARAKFDLVQRLATTGSDVGDIADVLQSHTIRLLKEQYAKATGRQAELATRYGPRHPEMQKIAAEVSEAHAQLDIEIKRLVSNLHNELQVAERRERDLNESLNSLKGDDALSKSVGVKLKELQRDADSTKSLYESLLARYKQTVETQSLQLPDARIVEQADAPLFPAAPKRKQIVILATFGGGALGLMIAVFIEFFTFGIGRPEDVERVFELAHLASLPAAASDEPPRAALQDMRIMVAEPTGTFAEAIRAMRREVDVRRAFDGPRIVQIAAALPGEGGSIVASNLALHYALTGARVLLIDGDLRRAHLTRELAAGRRYGLADAIANGFAPESLILRDTSTGLNFLPALGPAPTTLAAAEILSSQSTAHALHRLKSQFDLVVVDAPPLLPVIDGRILADHADQIVFVMSWRRTPKQLARRALSSLGFNQSKLVGVVVNQVDAEILADQHGGTHEPRRAWPSQAPPHRRAA